MHTNKSRLKELGDFLKTRRARISPSQVGILNNSRRRTPGLRREEVAQLSGISLTWYTWLEQGRDIQVSTQVIESLSRVLLLNKEEQVHLHMLANQPLPTEIPEYQGHINPILQNFLDSVPTSPSLIIDQRWNVIAWNKSARLVLGDFPKMNARERNIVWSMFALEEYKTLIVDWELHAKGLLGMFRSSFGQYTEDQWISQLTNDLKETSSVFKSWWSLHEIKGNSQTYKSINHPNAGILHFEVSKFDVSNNSGLKLIVHTPSNETNTFEKMKKMIE